MRRSRMLRPLPAAPVDANALRRRALSLRGRCRKHGITYPLNVLQGGVVVAAGCPCCYPAHAQSNR